MKDGYRSDVYARNDSGLAKYQFTWETIDVYSCRAYNAMVDLDPFASLKD